jgi:hypothetical protein
LSITTTSREANVSFRTSSHKAKNIYGRANNNPPDVAHNRNTHQRLFTMTILLQIKGGMLAIFIFRYTFE